MNDALQLFIQKLLEALLPVLASLLTTAAIALVYQAARWVRSKLKAEQLATINALVALAVKAAEQSGIIGAIENEADSKKDWALEEAQRLLDERGLKGVSVLTLDTLIEAAIKDGIHKGDPLARLAEPPPSEEDTRPLEPPTGSRLIVNAASLVPPHGE